MGSTPGQGSRSHMPQLRVCMLQLKIPHAATKTQCSQLNKYFFKREINLYLKNIHIEYAYFSHLCLSHNVSQGVATGKSQQLHGFLMFLFFSFSVLSNCFRPYWAIFLHSPHQTIEPITADAWPPKNKTRLGGYDVNFRLLMQEIRCLYRTTSKFLLPHTDGQQTHEKLLNTAHY